MNLRSLYFIMLKFTLFSLFFSLQGFGRLSLAAQSAAQSAANVVQASTKEISSKVFLNLFLLNY